MSDSNLSSERPDIFKIKQNAELVRDRFIKKHGLLSKRNLSVVSALKSLFLHGGWLHLFSNMLILLIMGAYVEARTSSFLYLGLYLIGGTFAAYFFTLLSPGTNILVGASSSTSVLMGAFLIFFGKNKINVLVSYLLIINKTIFIPVSLYILTFFILSDIVGVYLSKGTVAHGAHILGFMFGLFYALFHKKFFPLPEGVVFSEELEYFKRYRSQVNKDDVRVLCKWFLMNPNSLYSLERIAKTNSINHPKIVKQLNKSFKINYKNLNFYDALSINSLKHINNSTHVESLINLYESLDETKNLKLKTKLLYLICKSLDWSSEKWNEKLLNPNQNALLEDGELQKFIPESVKQSVIQSDKDLYERRIAS